MLTKGVRVCVSVWVRACVPCIRVCVFVGTCVFSVFGGGAARGMYYTSKKGQAQTQSRAKG